MAHSRREFLQQSGVVGASAVGLGTVARQESKVTRRFIIPKVEEFQDNYQGQWLQVNGTAEAHDEVADNCEFADWEAGNSVPYDSLLLDRRSETPVSVDLTAYGNNDRERIRESTVFIVNSVTECGAEWIGLTCETVPRRAIVGKAPGPTVSEDEGGDGNGGTDGGVGLGGLTALAAVGAGAAARFFRGGDEE